MSVQLHTERLLLREWRPEDLAPYAALNADPEVRRWLGPTLTRAQSDDQVARFHAHIDAHGYGFWAVEPVLGGPCIGFVGLQHVSFEAPFTPAVEIGWRLAREHWRQGFATEAATAALTYAFGPLLLSEVVAFTAPENVASRAVMEKIGMTHDAADDFDHPGVAEGDPLRRHVLYRARRGE